MKQSEVKEIGKNRKRVFAKKLEQIADGQLNIQEFLDKSFINPQLHFIAIPYIQKIVKLLMKAKTRGQKIDILDPAVEKLENFNKEYHYVVRTKAAVAHNLIRANKNGLFVPSIGMLPYVKVTTISPTTYKVEVLSTNVYFVCSGNNILEEVTNQ